MIEMIWILSMLDKKQNDKMGGGGGVGRNE